MTNLTLEDNNSLAANLSKLIVKNGITITELARLIDAKQPVLYRISHGMTKNPSILTLLPIARYFGITLNQLMGEPEAIPNRKLNSNLKARAIPVLKLEDIAKHPLNCDWDHAITAAQVDVPISENGFGMILSDTTMSPQFLPGYTLIFDPQQPEQDRTYVAVAYQAGHVGFKQLLIDGSKRYLKSANPDFPIQELQTGDRIIGTLVQARFNPSITQTKKVTAKQEVA